MLSSVLRSERAIQINVAIMRAFTRLREKGGMGNEGIYGINSLARWESVNG